MLSNRSSSSRALKLTITALQSNAGKSSRVNGSIGHRRLPSDPGHGSDLNDEHEILVCRESVHTDTVREFRKLYGLLRIESRKYNPSPSLSNVGFVKPPFVF